MNLKNYKVDLILNNHEYDDFKGYVPLKCNNYFEGSLHINTFSHDLFEHFFEFSKYFRTKELSEAGECVAMGVRTYLDYHSSIVQNFMGFNKYKGIEWNSWNTCIGQISESLEYPDKYTIDFDYKTLPFYKKNNIFKGYCESYRSSLSEKLNTQIEEAFSYGYWLGEYLFKDRLNMIYDFLELLKDYLSYLDVDSELGFLPEKITFVLNKGISLTGLHKSLKI